jgi:hypothetical protein
MVDHRHKKRGADEEGQGVDEPRGANRSAPSVFGGWQTWARMLLGYGLILAYITLTASLGWCIERILCGTWGVPPGQDFHGSGSSYLLFLSVVSPVLIPVLLLMLGFISFGAYRLGLVFWPTRGRGARGC